MSVTTAYALKSSADPRRVERMVGRLCGLRWARLTRRDLTAVAWAYYYFSIQFRENLEIACGLYPRDPALARLRAEECATANLSPYPNVVLPGEAIDHDEFMRRVLDLMAPGEVDEAACAAAGQRYLDEIRHVAPGTRAASMASYEDGGLERLFRAMLQAPSFGASEGLFAFRYFLRQHIAFDSNPEGGHGSLSRHLPADDGVAALWDAFYRLVTALVPALEQTNREHTIVLRY